LLKPVCDLYVAPLDIQQCSTLLSLGKEAAAQVMQNLSEDEVKALSRAFLTVSEVDRETQLVTATSRTASCLNSLLYLRLLLSIMSPLYTYSVETLQLHA